MLGTDGVPPSEDLLFRRVQRPLDVIGLGLAVVLLDVLALTATVNVVHCQVRHRRDSARVATHRHDDRDRATSMNFVPRSCPPSFYNAYAPAEITLPYPTLAVVVVVVLAPEEPEKRMKQTRTSA